jgi:hypothetical protein
VAGEATPHRGCLRCHRRPTVMRPAPPPPLVTIAASESQVQGSVCIANKKRAASRGVSIRLPLFGRKG